MSKSQPPRQSSTQRFARGIRHRLLKWLDFRLVRWYRLSDYQQAWYLKRLFKLLEIDLLIDVGGNEGQFARFARKRLGYQGPLITFEPIPELARKLRQAAQSDPNWTNVNAALGEVARRDTFNIMKSSPMSSLLNPSQDSTMHLSSFNEVSSSIEVEVDTLDDYLAKSPHLAGHRNIYLKLDVQGFEKKVLEGAQKSLPRVSAMQAEFSVIPLYQNQPDYKEMQQYIEDCGYLLSFIPAHNYEQFPEMIDFDCHFIRRERLELLGSLKKKPD